ncbi:MAG TPA: hypothetical protein VFJ58_28095 [Armatimonadota bacterium]|nr:hypothetical protein [Armatimonadota bacterium]
MRLLDRAPKACSYKLGQMPYIHRHDDKIASGRPQVQRLRCD